MQFPDALSLMDRVMRAHPWWRKRCEGTPLENDLPVRAAEVMVRTLNAQAAEAGSIALRRYLALKMLREFAIEGNWNSGVHLVIRKWIDAGMNDPIPWPGGASFAEWAAKEDLSNVDGFVGYRMTAVLTKDGG